MKIKKTSDILRLSAARIYASVIEWPFDTLSFIKGE